MSSFGRRTWDKEEYAEKAREGHIAHEGSLKSSLSAAQLQALKAKYTNYHALMQNSMKNLNKKVLASGLSSYKSGKQFGFYCELCNLTFKDSLQYIDHLNHKTHQIKFESIFEEPLIIETRDNDDVDLKEFEDCYANLIVQFTNLHDTKKRKQANKTKVRQKLRKVDKSTAVEPTDIQIAMGFNSFGGFKN